MRSKAVCYLFLFGIVYIFFNRNTVSRFNVFNYDKSGYYSYLPALLIYNDIGHLSFLDTLAPGYEIGGGAKYGLNMQANGKWLNKYPIGVSLFEAPGFLAAHLYCHITQTYPADGYSEPYEAGLILNSILWSFLALLVLRRFLLMHFTDTIAAIVLVCIGMGTNFFTYAAFEHGMSHNYSFFLFACLVLFTDKWHASHSSRHLCVIAIVLGFIIIVRPVNIFAVLIPLSWGVYNRDTLVNKGKAIFGKLKPFLLAIVLVSAVVFIQLAYWKVVSGSWVVYSYTNERFVFADPKISEGLFGFRKGWFIYTPIALVSIVGLWFTGKRYLLTYILFLPVTIYVTFSWQNWYYGYGFGARSLIDILPLLAFPLANITHRILTGRSRSARLVYSISLTFFVALNIFQSYQYSSDVIAGDKMTAAYYWRIFGKPRATPEDRQLLMNDEEYWGETESWNEN